MAVISQPTAIQPISQRTWKYGLFDSPDLDLLCVTCLCPCCVFGATADEVGDSAVLCCLAYSCTLLNPYLWWANTLLGCCYRNRVRKRYAIEEGNLMCDFCAYLFCCPCVLMQTGRQAEFELHRRRRAAGQECGCATERGVMLRVGSREFHCFGSGRTLLGCRYFATESHRLLLSGTETPSECTPPYATIPASMLPRVYGPTESHPGVSMIIQAQVNATDTTSGSDQTPGMSVSPLSMECGMELTSANNAKELIENQPIKTNVKEWFAGSLAREMGGELAARTASNTAQGTGMSSSGSPHSLIEIVDPTTLSSLYTERRSTTEHGHSNALCPPDRYGRRPTS